MTQTLAIGLGGHQPADSLIGIEGLIPLVPLDGRVTVGRTEVATQFFGHGLEPSLSVGVLILHIRRGSLRPRQDHRRTPIQRRRSRSRHGSRVRPCRLRHECPPILAPWARSTKGRSCRGGHWCSRGCYPCPYSSLHSLPRQPKTVRKKARLRVPYTGSARIYGTSCLTYQGTPKKLGLLSSWDSYIIT